LASTQPPSTAGSQADHPYSAELEAERSGWYALADLVRSLTPEECLVLGYFRDPDWTVRDLVAHLGTWLAEGEIQLERISAGTYEGHDLGHRCPQRAVPGGHGGRAVGQRLGSGQRRPDQAAPAPPCDPGTTRSP